MSDELSTAVAGVVAGLQNQMANELMKSWREGVQIGLEMAAKMTEALLVQGEPNEAQQVVIRGLVDAFREAKSETGGAS